MNKFWIAMAVVLSVVGVYATLTYLESEPELDLNFAIRHRTETPGIVAANDPVQINLSDRRAFQHDGYTVTPFASFEVNARVLSRRRYRFNRAARLSPVDLALGWGQMSDKRILKHIKVGQGKRWYFWRARELPIPARQIQLQSANMHMIPAHDQVRAAILRARKGDVVSFRGYLVQVFASDGFRWVSSSTRTDVGARSCEVVWVEAFEVVGPGLSD